MLIKLGKNDRLVFDASAYPSPEAKAMNDMVTNETEPFIDFPPALMNHLMRTCNLRISHPNEDILSFDDDVSGAFRQVKHNPDIIAALSFRALGCLCVPTAQTFGARFSPPNWEPFRRARENLAEMLASQPQIENLHKRLTDRIKFSDPPDETTQFVKATPDAIDKGTIDDEGNELPTPF